MNPNDPLPLAIVIVGTVASFLLALSPLPLIYRVWKSKDAGFFRADAFIVGIPFGVANGTYSLYSGQIVAFISTIITAVLYSVYLGILAHFSVQAAKRRIYRRSLIAGFSAGFLTGVGPAVFRIVDSSQSGSIWFGNHGGVETFMRTWLGVAATISVTLLLSGQVPAMIEVFKTKDARPISLEMTLGGLLASLVWLTYASLILDVFYIVSNGIGAASGMTLLYLKLRYRTVVANEEPQEVPLETMSKDLA